MRADPDSPIGIAVLGCGRISATHIAAIKSQPQSLNLVAVIDQDLSGADLYAK